MSSDACFSCPAFPPIAYVPLAVVSGICLRPCDPRSWFFVNAKMFDATVHSQPLPLAETFQLLPWVWIEILFFMRKVTTEHPWCSLREATIHGNFHKTLSCFVQSLSLNLPTKGGLLPRCSDLPWGQVCPLQEELPTQLFSAPPVYLGQAFHVTLCLPFHSKSAGALNHFHLRTMVGSGAMSFCKAALLGIRKKRGGASVGGP